MELVAWWGKDWRVTVLRSPDGGTLRAFVETEFPLDKAADAYARGPSAVNARQNRCARGEIGMSKYQAQDSEYDRPISRVANNARETLIHVILMMAVEKGRAGVAGDKIDLRL